MIALRQSIPLFLLFVLSGCWGDTIITRDSNLDPEFSGSIKSILILGMGDDELVDCYESIMDTLILNLEEAGIEEVRSFVLDYNDKESEVRLANELNDFDPSAVLLIRPYFQYTGAVRVKALDVSVEIMPYRKVIWHGYVDVQIMGSDKFEDSYYDVRKEIISLLEQDGILSK